MSEHTFLHLIHRYYPFRGGSEFYFQALSERFASHGDTVHVFATDAWDLEYLWDPTRRRVEEQHSVINGVLVHRVRAKHLPLARYSHQGIRRIMGELSRLPVPGRSVVLQQLSAFGPWLPDLPCQLTRFGDGADLIHAANIALEAMIQDAASFAKRRDIPLLITPKLHLGENEQSIVRRYYSMPHQIDLLKQADMIMTQTRIEKEFLTNFGIDEDRIRVVGLGIDVAAVTNGNGQRARDVLKIEGPIVLALGAAAFDKGTVHLCEAIREVNRGRHDPVSLIVAGPIMRNFQDYFDGLDAQDAANIRVLGFVDDDMRNDLLAATNVLALPSRTEAFGYVFLEAWANEKPVIGARAGGIPAVIDEDVDGLLVDFGDVKALSAAIDDLIDNPELARRMGIAGSAKVVDITHWFGNINSIYHEVLGSSGPTERT